MNNNKIDLVLTAIHEQGKRIEEQGKRIEDLRFDMNRRFDEADRRFDEVDRKFIEIHDDIRDLKQDNRDIKMENKEIKNEFIKPLERGERIRIIRFTSMWGMISLFMTVIGSLMGYGIARAFS